MIKFYGKVSKNFENGEGSVTILYYNIWYYIDSIVDDDIYHIWYCICPYIIVVRRFHILEDIDALDPIPEYYGISGSLSISIHILQYMLKYIKYTSPSFVVSCYYDVFPCNLS